MKCINVWYVNGIDLNRELLPISGIRAWLSAITPTVKFQSWQPVCLPVHFQTYILPFVHLELPAHRQSALCSSLLQCIHCVRYSTMVQKPCDFSGKFHMLYVSSDFVWRIVLRAAMEYWVLRPAKRTSQYSKLRIYWRLNLLKSYCCCDLSEYWWLEISSGEHTVVKTRTITQSREDYVEVYIQSLFQERGDCYSVGDYLQLRGGKTFLFIEIQKP